jgi:hypothetical protein
LTEQKKAQGETNNPVWHGKPSVGSYILIYGVLAIISILVLVTLEYFGSHASAAGGALFPYSIRSGGVVIPFPVEIATVVIIAILLAGKVIELAIIWATNTYDLMSDGIYINQGIINLQNTFVSSIAFSDARLIRNWILRIAGRGLIIIEANDGRRFYLKYVKNPLQVQSLIRSTLGHPTIRTER